MVHVGHRITRTQNNKDLNNKNTGITGTLKDRKVERQKDRKTERQNNRNME